MRFAPIVAGLLGFVASCTTPQTLPIREIPVLVEKPAVVTLTREEKLDSMYTGFIKAYNSARSNRDFGLNYLTNNDGSLNHIFHEDRARDNYFSNVDKMQGYIAEIKSLGAETRPFDILLETIR